jgi:hypothetical protein
MCEQQSQRSGRERSDEMGTLNAKGRAGRYIGLVAALALIGWAAGARAQISVAASDLPGGYVVLPKVVVHTTGGTPPVVAGGVATDTLIQMTNVNQSSETKVDCWWVNANSHCGGCTGQNCGPVCDTNADCTPGLNCLSGWSVLDFTLVLTPGQPVGFTASSGLNPVPCDTSDFSATCKTTTMGGNVLRVPEDPFRGELKCVAVDENDVPLGRNDLKIEATIVSTVVPGAGTPATTAASYNGIAFASVGDGSGAPGDPLCLGSAPSGSSATCAQTYAPCPGVLIFDHFFDGASTELGGAVSTDLTLVPCSEDLGDPSVAANFEVVAQMLVYNEFEQRFSTSSRVRCYRATRLVDIDTPLGPSGDAFSVFSAGVEGTLTGQTRIRGVQGAGGRLGYGLLGVACESFSATPGGQVLATDAFNLHDTGFRPLGAGDAVYRTNFPPPPP